MVGLFVWLFWLDDVFDLMLLQNRVGGLKESGNSIAIHLYA